jgi:phenylacetate-CoA ligase
MIRDAAITWHLLREARRSSRRPSDWFRLRQEGVLRRLLRHAYDRVPLYRRLWDESGFRPEAFRTLADLERVPPLSKPRLKEADPTDTIAAGTNTASCMTAATSGSTGAPMQFLLGPFERCWNRAVAWRILFEHGFRWTDRTLEIRMTKGPTYAIQRLGVAPKVWMSILEPPSAWVDRLVSEQPQCVMAGAGTLDLLAAAIGDAPVRPPQIVISDSETLTPSIRMRIHAALGTDPIDVYGLEEVSNFAWECERRAGLHISADSHIVEVGAPPGEIGPLTVTALGMWTMPFIRYQTGDLAAASPHACPCGRTLPLLSSLHGRAVDSIELSGGRRLLWPFFHELLGGVRGVIHWQAVQETGTDIVVRVVLSPPSDDQTARIAATLRDRLPGECTLRVESVKSIPPEANGKRRLVIPRRP